MTIRKNYADLRRKGLFAKQTKRVVWKTPSRFIV